MDPFEQAQKKRDAMQDVRIDENSKKLRDLGTDK